MDKLYINKEQFSDLLNLHYGVFHPLKKFVNEKAFKSILLSNKINKKFFPFPIYFGVSEEKYKKYKYKKHLNIYYKKKDIGIIKINNFFKIKNELFGKKLFGVNYKKHPYYIKFLKENFAFIDFSYKKLNKINLNHKNFESPQKLKERLKKKIKGRKFLAGFHTRNVPHLAHQWIHFFMLKKYKNILIQPLINQYKVDEYKESIIIKTNKAAVNMYDKNKAFFSTYFSFPRYGGPCEAALHAIVRKNYGCTHCWIGRDHAGYKSFFKKYSSQQFCKKKEKKMGINIIAEDEPYFCSKCDKIVNKKCSLKNCKKKYKKNVSGTIIRNLIKRKKKINDYLMNKNISTLLNSNSLIKK